MKAITTTVYQANDGSIWPTEAEGLSHEAELIAEEENTYYARVISGPDLTEGRGFSRLVYLRIKGLDTKYLAEELVLDWCYRAYGRPIAFIQGTNLTLGWTIRGIDREDWVSAGLFNHYDRPYISCGDIKSYAKQVTLILGPKETGLMADPVENCVI